MLDNLIALGPNKQGALEFYKPDDGGIYIQIPGGAFLYGDNQEQKNVETYLISKFEITNLQFLKFLLSTRADLNDHKLWLGQFTLGKEFHPAVCISHNDAVECCKWSGTILPTEEMWEKAARGTDGRKYTWGNEWNANFYHNSESVQRRNMLLAIPSYTTSSVDVYADSISPYGVWDMLGNVWEWTSTEWK